MSPRVPEALTRVIFANRYPNPPVSAKYLLSEYSPEAKERTVISLSTPSAFFGRIEDLLLSDCARLIW